MPITLNLDINEVNVILQGLGELPFRLSSDLIKKIHEQAKPQIESVPKTEPTSED
jgi:hypothetical protein